MKKEYIKPTASLVETLGNYCLEDNLKEISGYSGDHTIIMDGLYEE